MKRLLSRHWRPLLTLLFGVAVFLFWRYRYPFALTYQEQFQLFLFDEDYLLSRMAEPGGLARYVGEFLTQFYNGVALGALVLAVVFMLAQRLVWRLMSHGPSVAGNRPFYSLSFLPAILLWYTMGDENVLLAYAVALILAMAAALGLNRLGRLGKWWVWGSLVVAVPVLYWLIGPMVVLVCLCLTSPLAAAVALVYAAGCIIGSAHLLPFPLDRLWLGLGYYRYVETLPYVLIALPMVVCILTYVARIKLKTSLIVETALTAAVGLAAVLLVPYGFDARKYELIEYDYLVRVKDWKGIIAKAERKTPDLPMSVCATNLALAMTNQLGERAFDFYQRSGEGLIPPFERNFTTALMTGEVYFHLGLVNSAQRFAFESMEAIPNFNKSARAVKRLAETNLINGQYEVARKYLEMLAKTIFYRPWAKRTMELMKSEQAIDSHPLYGWLRKARLTDDFLFSEQETDKICGQLFMHNQQNQMAAQYLLLAPLLDRDVPRFMQYVQVVQNRIKYNPRICQEAIAFAFMQQHQQLPQGIVSPLVASRLKEFSSIYAAGGADAPGLAKFRNTVWYYLTVGK